MSLLSRLFNKVLPIQILKTSIDREIAGDLSIEVAVQEGLKLAKTFYAEIEAIGQRQGLDYSDALLSTLSANVEGSSNDVPGSLLEAACIGVAAGIAQAAFYAAPEERSQDRVMHWSIAKGIAEWEVGKGAAGHHPFPWQTLPDGSEVHFSYAPGALTGGIRSIAHFTMQRTVRLWRVEAPDKNAPACMKWIAVMLGIAPAATYESEISEVARIGIYPEENELPDGAIEELSRYLLCVDTFWPALLKEKTITWKND